jgi:hypothetical protein
MNRLFNGFNFTIDYRKDGTSWPNPYRIQILPNKQERQDYRITVFGDSIEEVIQLATEKVEGVVAMRKMEISVSVLREGVPEFVVHSILDAYAEGVREITIVDKPGVVGTMIYGDSSVEAEA